MTDVHIDTANCPLCGDSPIVTTDAKQDGAGWVAYDGDPVRCFQPLCGATGQVAICGEDENGDAFAEVTWNDDLDES